MSGEIIIPGSSGRDPSSKGPNEPYFDDAQLERRAIREVIGHIHNFLDEADNRMPQTDPHTQEDLAQARGSVANVLEAEFFGSDENYKNVFEQALDNGNTDPHGLAISQMHAFSLSVLPYLPPARVILNSHNMVDFAWKRRELGVLAATGSPKEFEEALWQPNDLLSAITRGGRKVNELKEGLQREKDLLGNFHFLASNRQFDQAKVAVTSGDKVISGSTHNITATGKHGFGNWLQQQGHKDRPITWANLGNLGDRFYMPLIGLVSNGDVRFAPDCTFIGSTRVRYESKKSFSGEWKGDLPPLTYCQIGSQALSTQLLRGMSEYPPYLPVIGSKPQLDGHSRRAI